jgi:hypothetical protein
MITKFTTVYAGHVDLPARLANSERRPHMLEAARRATHCG